MPGPIPTGTSRTFGLYLGGNNVTAQSRVESVSISETAGDSNSTLEFDVEWTRTAAAANYIGAANYEARLEDLTNSRRLFKGRVVNTRRRHMPGSGVIVHYTAISDDAWLDRIQIPSWTSKRPNTVNIATDRLQVQNLIAAVAATPTGAPFDAINTYVASTQAAMPVVNVPNGGSVRSILQAIAEAAATAADPTARRFYVDFDNHLHWYKGSESLTAPYILGDASYTTTVKATAGILSLVQFREDSGTPTDPYGAATVTLNGGYTQNVASMVPNERSHRSTTFNGTTGYASLAGATLHQVDGPWSVELWFKRGATLGTAQTMVSAGANDYLIAFDASNKLIVQKEGTGDNFVSTPAYTDTSPHHLVVTRAVGTTTVYVDGASIAGATTARTFASAAGAVNIGRKLSTTNLFFTGSIQAFAFYNTTLSAATVLAHYNDAWTLVPDDFEFESDHNDAGFSVYVRGGNANGTGWVRPTPQLTSYTQSFLLDRPQSTSASLKTAIGTGFIYGDAKPVHGFRAVITMPASTWRAGQTVTIDNNALGIPDTQTSFTIPAAFEIRQLNTMPNLGSGVVTYEMYGGAMPWSGTFAVQRKKRK